MEGEGKEEKGMGGKGRDVAPPMKISAYAPARFHVQIQDTDYMKQRSIDTMTPNKLAIYFVADMVLADMVVADSEAVPKSSRGWKWKNLLRRILKDKSQYEGQGMGTTVVIPSDPDALLDRLDILLASKAAGTRGLEMKLLVYVTNS